MVAKMLVSLTVGAGPESCLLIKHQHCFDYVLILKILFRERLL